MSLANELVDVFEHIDALITNTPRTQGTVHLSAWQGGSLFLSALPVPDTGHAKLAREKLVVRLKKAAEALCALGAPWGFPKLSILFSRAPKGPSYSVQWVDETGTVSAVGQTSHAYDAAGARARMAHRIATLSVPPKGGETWHVHAPQRTTARVRAGSCQEAMQANQALLWGTAHSPQSLIAAYGPPLRVVPRPVHTPPPTPALHNTSLFKPLHEAIKAAKAALAPCYPPAHRYSPVSLVAATTGCDTDPLNAVGCVWNENLDIFPGADMQAAQDAQASLHAFACDVMALPGLRHTPAALDLQICIGPNISCSLDMKIHPDKPGYPHRGNIRPTTLTSFLATWSPILSTLAALPGHTQLWHTPIHAKQPLHDAPLVSAPDAHTAAQIHALLWARKTPHPDGPAQEFGERAAVFDEDMRRLHLLQPF